MAEANNNIVLTEGCQECLARAASVIDYRNNSLESGSVSVQNVISLQEHAEKFATVTALSTKATHDMTYKLIQLRCKEVEAIQTKTDLVTNFSSLCQNHLLKKGNLHIVLLHSLQNGYFIICVLMIKT